MPGKWDTSTKRLVGENPEDFIRWLVPEAKFEGKAKARPLNLNDREIEADALYEITLYGVSCLVHIEFQRSYDESMDRRMWEYNALATFSYYRPTCSFVIYLKKCEVPEPFFTWEFPNGEVGGFRCYKMCCETLGLTRKLCKRDVKRSVSKG